MTILVCVGCGFEIDDSDIKEELCPYCGEQMVKKVKIIAE
jgi:predicted RNA-binding Zn-ribbon protein involved in translation (DUF1610 family)